VNKVRKPGRPDLYYVRPHEIQVLFAGDPQAELHATVEHVFAAGPGARLTLRLGRTSETIDADITREQLDEMALDAGDEVGLRLPVAAPATIVDPSATSPVTLKALPLQLP
jgi:microcystin degradation protein MlrC